MGQVFNALLGAISAVNVNAAIGIGNGSLFQSRDPFVIILRAPGAMEFFIVALAFLESRIPAADEGTLALVIPSVDTLQLSCSEKRCS
jgi:hypothetical protein